MRMRWRLIFAPRFAARFGSMTARGRCIRPMPRTTGRCRSGWWYRAIRRSIAAVALARKHGAPILGRGAGTSLAGQCCNVAVVVDMSKYMHGIAEMNPAEKFARVEPGIVLDDLRRAAEKHGLTFRSRSGHARAVHARRNDRQQLLRRALDHVRKTVDNIEELDVLTYDGIRMRVGATSEAELQSIIAEGGRLGEIYAGLKSIRDRYAGTDPCEVSAHPATRLRLQPGRAVAGERIPRSARAGRQRSRRACWCWRRRQSWSTVHPRGRCSWPAIPMSTKRPTMCRAFLRTSRSVSKDSTTCSCGSAVQEDESARDRAPAAGRRLAAGGVRRRDAR